MEIVVSVAFVAFGIIFIAFIFIKSFIDSKKEKTLMTDIFLKHGVKIEAKILSFKENGAYGRHGIQGKYNFSIEFQYSSTKNREITCSYTLTTNNPKSKKYIDSIPIIFIPAYLDYYMELISREDFLMLLGINLILATTVGW